MSAKLADERAKKQLIDIASTPGNDACADCKARAPRWASHNLGIFICVRCATVHRKIGTHITKVKSLTLDSWTKDQIDNMRNNGNAKSNAYYIPNEARHPPPTNLEESERDGELETYIRSKYEYKRFIDRTPARPPTVQPQSSASVQRAPPPRAQSTPLTQQPAVNTAPAPALRPPSVQPAQPVFSSTLQYRPSTSQPPAPVQPAAPPALAPASFTPPKPQVPTGGVWDDLMAVQSGGPLQPSSYSSMQSPALPPAPPPSRSMTMPAGMSPSPSGVPQFQSPGFPGMSPSPGNPYAAMQAAPTPFSSPMTSSPMTSPPTGYTPPSHFGQPSLAAAAQMQHMQQQQHMLQQQQQQMLQQQQQQQQQQLLQQQQQQQQQQQHQLMQQQQHQQQLLQQQQYLQQQQQQQQQQYQPAFNAAQFMPPQQTASPFQAQASGFMPQQQQTANPFGQGWQQQQQYPGQQPMYAPPGWPST